MVWVVTRNKKGTERQAEIGVNVSQGRRNQCANCRWRDQSVCQCHSQLSLAIPTKPMCQLSLKRSNCLPMS